MLNEQGGDNQQQHTRQFRGLRQVSQRVVSPMNLRNVILYVILLEKKHEGGFIGILAPMADQKMPLKCEWCELDGTRWMAQDGDCHTALGGTEHDKTGCKR